MTYHVTCLVTCHVIVNVTGHVIASASHVSFQNDLEMKIDRAIDHVTVFACALMTCCAPAPRCGFVRARSSGCGCGCDFSNVPEPLEAPVRGPSQLARL